MAEVNLSIGGRSYAVACKAGGEDHLRAIAAYVDGKAAEARAAVGDSTETRQLLFAALLLADELSEARAGIAPPPVDPRVGQALVNLADRIERVADGLEGGSRAS